MAITVDWPNKIINVPKADTQLIQSSPTEIRSLDLDTFRLTLKDLEDDVGMPFLDTHSHVAPITVGGVTLARVIEIINGYTITFEDGQYAVNLVGANSNVGDVTNVNQVSVRSANSAGLTYSKQVEDLAFTAGRVYVDTLTGQNGVQYPRGTAADPVDNWDDALTIVTARGLAPQFNIRGELEFYSDDDLDFSEWLADASSFSTLRFFGASTNNMLIEGATIMGDLSGRVELRDSGVALQVGATPVGGVTNFNGIMLRCGIVGDLTFAADNVFPQVLTDCLSPTNIIPTIDVNGMAADVSIIGYRGHFNVVNATAGNTLYIHLNGGHVIIDASCTNATFDISGDGEVEDNSTGSTTVDSDHLVKPSVVTKTNKMLTHKTITDPTTGIMTVYDVDGTTVLYQTQLYEDAAGTQTYRGQGAERRELI